MPSAKRIRDGGKKKPKRRGPCGIASPKHPKRIAARLMHGEWVRKALDGTSLTAIAEEYGKAVSTVSEAIDSYLAEYARPEAEKLRARWTARIERALVKVWPLFEDPATVPVAVNSLVRLSKRASEITGCDEPPKAAVDKDGNTVPSFLALPGQVPKTVEEWVRDYGNGAQGKA